MVQRCWGSFVLLLAWAASLGAQTPPLRVAVDATEAARRFVRVALTIPAKPGPLTLVYPKWIPGEHGPSGPLIDLAGLKMSANGEPVAWQRDDVDVYAFHCKVPKGAKELEVKLDFLSPPSTAAFSSGASMTPHLAVLNWNQFVLVPQGAKMRELQCQGSVQLPKGWKLATSMPTMKADGATTTFAPATLEVLLDAPVICGEHFRIVPIGPFTGPKHRIALACDSAGGLEMDPATRKKFDRLVVEAQMLFGGQPYHNYTFLLALSDHLAHFGLEHYSSSDNRMPERVLLDGRIGKTSWGQLLPHEFVHAWNGKYRRPQEMVVDDFQKPQRTKLLWVYEGLTQYYGTVLTTRCGLWTDEQFRDHLATIGEWAKNQRGRTWRPLEDTAVAAQLLYYARGDWASWRRGTDFYDEGTLLWLDADTLIREKTKGKKSLDDFCRRFHAVDPKFPLVKPFTFDDLVADLNAIVPHDWKGFLETRVKGTSGDAPLQGITRGGWTLTYADKASEFQQANEDDSKTIDLNSSLGMSLRSEGQVSDVVHGKPAHAAGVGPGMKLVAVNTRRWTSQVLRDALADSKKTGKKLSLLFENGDIFRTLEIDYRDGERFPALERVTASPDLLGAITRPLAPPPEKK